ncbi:BRO-A [Parapoynx stagnalis nucleopolyhedrovirus]|uniref:BRO-A n=1 Tax=Parapoynx stagnalis nucleopolyhedrovirus TaxID=2993413 RepID=A0A9E7Y6U5_9ABAC|nr:BRO-A [Parapoynx stagnalis nucleopolyhedrovirus]
MSERVVNYSTPRLLVAREINATGQKIHVTKKKHDLLKSGNIIINTVRPNPQVDFNNIVNRNKRI